MSDTRAPRAMHHRTIDHRTWLHEDGVLELEGRLVDTKAYDTRIGFGRELPAGEPVHDMTIRILLGPDWRIRDIRLQMAHTPFDICSEVIRRFENLRGESMGKGWNALLNKRFSGAGGCRHLIDLLRGMATVAFQSMPGNGWTEEALAFMADSCHAFEQGGAVMVRLAEDIEKRKNKVDE
jgi:hypothetical protein